MMLRPPRLLLKQPLMTKKVFSILNLQRSHHSKQPMTQRLLRLLRHMNNTFLSQLTVPSGEEKPKVFIQLLPVFQMS
jgi:hypothetical protein